MSASQPRQSRLVVFADASNTKRVLLPLPNTYNAALELAHRHFPSVDFETIALQTDELAICRGERVYITAESWEQVVLHVSRLHVVSNPDADASMDNLTASETETVVDTVPKLSINLRDCELRTLTIVIGHDTSMRKAMNAWMQHFDEPDSEPRFMIGYERRVTDRDTARGLGLRDGDVIDVFKKHVGGKPVIYLFSPVDVEAHVKLSLVPQWEFSAVYPVVPIKSSTGTSALKETIEWTVATRPDGSLTEVSTGLDVAYLFWEAHTNKATPVSPPPSPRLGEKQMEYFVPSETSVNPSNALLLSIADLPKYLDKALNALSLHTEARTSFITYWLPSLLKHTHIAIRFLPQVSYERAAPLEIIPSPNVVTRVFMLFRGVDDDALSQWTDRWARQDDAELDMWRNCVGVDLDEALNDKLFRVLEWGGMEVDA